MYNGGKGPALIDQAISPCALALRKASNSCRTNSCIFMELIVTAIFPSDNAIALLLLVAAIVTSSSLPPNSQSDTHRV
eukprot:1400528-Ditylum_brightwellii.AAC.1